MEIILSPEVKALDKNLTPKSILLEFALNCDDWEAEALARSVAAKESGDEGQAQYEEGQAEGFEVAAKMARARADLI